MTDKATVTEVEMTIEGRTTTMQIRQTDCQVQFVFEDGTLLNLLGLINAGENNGRSEILLLVHPQDK